MDFARGRRDGASGDRRILEGLSPEASGHVFIEVADKKEEMLLAAPSGIAIHWLHRDGAEAATTGLLIDAIRAARWPDHSDVFAWVASEAHATRAIRDYLNKERNLPRAQCLAVGYWNRSKAKPA